MKKTLYLFVTSDRPDQYINPIIHCITKRGVNRVVLLYIESAENDNPKSIYSPANVSSVVLNNIIALFDSLVLRTKYVYRGGDKSKEGQEVDLRPIYGDRWDIIVEKFYQPFKGGAKIETDDISYSDLMTRMARFHKEEPECIFDVTAVSKALLGDIIALCITEGISNLHTFDVGKPNFSEPWKSLIHDLGGYKYVNVLNTEIYKECSGSVRALQVNNTTKPQESEALTEANAKAKRYEMLFRYTSLILMLVVSLGIVFILPTFIKWSWLDQHPKKLGLQLCAILLLGGTSWAVVDEKNRSLSFSTIVVAAVIGITQII